MKGKDKNDSNSIRPKFNGGPLALESAHITYLKNKDMFKNIPQASKKLLVFEEDKDNTTLLDESQLKEQ